MSKNKFNPQNWLNNQPNVEPQRATAQTEKQTSNNCCIPTTNDIEAVTQRIEATATDIAPTYHDWLDLGFALADALGENGRTYYQRLSHFYPNYSAAKTDKQFNRCLAAHGHGVTIKTLFHLAKQAGINVATQPPISSISAISAGDDFEDFEDLHNANHPEQADLMPTFSQEIQHALPPLLSQIVAKSNSPEDADLLLLGSLTVFSACLPNISGIYNGREVFPNLFLFVTAQASAGKGRLSLCRHLVEPIHSKLRDYYAAEMENYKRQQAEYVANKKNPNAEQPQEPPQRMLIMPANNSSTGVYQLLNDNNGVGLMFETEGDTLANTFKSDYGNFSDGFRKAFHHETISYNRRKDREFVELQKPRLSALLSGTPRQIQSLIPDAENGLFSRFMFYYMNVRLEWLNVFADSDNHTLDWHFQQLGERFYQLYTALQASQPIRFCLSSQQENEFNAFFGSIQQQYTALFGLDIVASVRRLGLITFRLAMILSTIRLDDNGDFSPTLVCNDTDFQTASAIVKVLLQHTAKVFQALPSTSSPQAANAEKTQQRQRFFDCLPPDFDRTIYIATAERLGIPPKTAERYINSWCKGNNPPLTHIAHGKYAKNTQGKAPS